MPDPTPAPSIWRPALTAFAKYVLPALAAAVATYLGLPPQVVEVVKHVEVQAPAPPPGPGPGPFGWDDDREAVKSVVGRLPIKSFGETPAGQMAAAPDRVYLWEAAKKARGGAHIPARNQGQVGSCVSFGAACAVEYLLAVQIATGRNADFQDIAQEPIYGGSRIQVGTKLHGARWGGDGSIGAFAAEWLEKWGAVPRGKAVAGIDLAAYSEQRCREYGSRGCPAALEPVAKERPVKSVAPVRSVAELKAALANGYPVSVASSVGFGQSGPYTRNALGQLRASGTWPHQMCFIGYDAQAGAYCMNSWGPTWVGGPTGPGDPPPGGFYVAWATVQRMLDAEDSFAFGDLSGFPERKLPDWFIAAPRPERFAFTAPARHPLGWRRLAATRFVPPRAEPAALGW